MVHCYHRYVSSRLHEENRAVSPGTIERKRLELSAPVLTTTAGAVSDVIS